MSSHDQGIERIRRLSQSAERRLRWGRGLRVFAQALCIALVSAIIDVALRKLGLIGERGARVFLAVAGGGAVVATAAAWALPLPDRAGARALDRFYGLHDRLASALAFADGPAATRTPFMQAAIDDAVAAVPRLYPTRAVPILLPRAFIFAAGLGAVLASLLLFEVRKHTLVASAKTIEAVEMAPDDLDDVEDFLNRAAQAHVNDDTKAAIEEFNALVRDLSNKRVDRTEAFRRMESLDAKLLTGSQGDKKTLEAQIDRIADELKKAELTRPAAEALADLRLDAAGDRLHDLAKKLREKGDGVDPAKLDQLREALKAAAASLDKQREELRQRRQELADEILRRQQSAGDAGTDAERSLLEKKQRELERMDRELGQQKDSEQGLDRLDRELAQAAEDLMKDLGLGARDLDQGAEDLNRMQQQQMTQEEKQQLRQKLQELRELVRQQGSGGKGQMVRLKRFARAARGQGGGKAGSGSEGQEEGSGEGQEQEKRAQGQPGQEGRDDDPRGQPGQEGAGQGGHGGETWVLGPNGEKMLMLSRAQGGGQGKDPGEGSGGEGQGATGRRWGEGHDSKVQGSATNPKMGTEDTQVQAGDTGQGGSRSQVILGAAERGFVSRSYKRVFNEYHQVAEESLAKDDIPGGYRFYVKRYFQLIRPRDGQ